MATARRVTHVGGLTLGKLWAISVRIQQVIQLDLPSQPDTEFIVYTVLSIHIILTQRLRPFTISLVNANSTPLLFFCIYICMLFKHHPKNLNLDLWPLLVLQYMGRTESHLIRRAEKKIFIKEKIVLCFSARDRI